VYAYKLELQNASKILYLMNVLKFISLRTDDQSTLARYTKVF